MGKNISDAQLKALISSALFKMEQFIHENTH